MKIEEIKISEIKLYKHNNKTHDKKQIELLKKTIEEFWYTNPVLLSDKNECIWGHWRIQAMQELWKEEIPAVYIKDLTPKQVRKLRLLDNKIAELAEDNLEAIKFELQELEDQELNELYDLDITTLDSDKEEIEDDIPEVSDNIIVEKWDIFQLWEHRLLCWDSTNIDDVEKLMDWEKADITFTSPPYNANTKSSEWDIFKKRWSKKLYDDWYSDNLQSDEYLTFVKDVLNNCFLVTDWFIFWNVSYNNNSRFEYIKQIEDRLKYLIEQICWKKTSSIPFKWSLMRDWEPIYVFSSNWNKLWLDKVTSNFWEVNNTNSQQENHKACFPIWLPQKALEILENKKNIFDPFWWSWSSLIASEKTNRKCYMMELDEKYIQVILKRYKNYTDWKKQIQCLNRKLNLENILN